MERNTKGREAHDNTAGHVGKGALEPGRPTTVRSTTMQLAIKAIEYQAKEAHDNTTGHTGKEAPEAERLRTIQKG